MPSHGLDRLPLALPDHPAAALPLGAVLPPDVPGAALEVTAPGTLPTGVVLVRGALLGAGGSATK